MTLIIALRATGSSYPEPTPAYLQESISGSAMIAFSRRPDRFSALYMKGRREAVLLLAVMRRRCLFIA
jgi:hypothetical protein